MVCDGTGHRVRHPGTLHSAPGGQGRRGGPDSIEYPRHAENLLDHGLYSLDGVRPDRVRQPLYPLFIAGIYAVFGRNNFAVYAIQTLVGCASIVRTVGLARVLGLSPAAAGGAGLLVAPVGGRAVGVCAIAITVGVMTLAA
jgi:hypothetical protein